MLAKKQLRIDIRRRRQALDDTRQQQAAAQALTHVTDSRLLHNTRKVALYLADRGELDPAPIIKTLWSQGQDCFLPILDDSGINRLKFAHYRPDSKLVANQFGILEPAHDPRELVEAQTLDLVFVPLVAFDAEGNRMGMGKGYYDHTFAFRMGNRQPPTLIGLAHSFQQVADLQPAEWDIPLDGVVTEQGFTQFQKIL